MTDLHSARRRSTSVFKNRALMLATALLVALTVLPGTPASADHFGGPVVLVGIDSEDCGPDHHGPIQTWIDVIKNGILANTTNGGDGILVIGAHPHPYYPGPIGFWNAIGEGTGETVTFGDENSSFAGYQMIAVVGSSPQTCVGLTRDQNTVLTSRAAEFASFVNGGGGLFAGEQTSFPQDEQLGFVGGLGAFATASPQYDDPQLIDGNYAYIEPTPAGTAVGVNDSLDLCCWHMTFTEFPDFLKPLAYRVTPGQYNPSIGQHEEGVVTSDVAALGGTPTIFPVTPGGEIPTHASPPPPPSPGLLDGVTGLVDTVTGLVNPGPSPTPDPTPSPPTADVGVAASAAGNATPPRDGSTGPVPIGGVKAGGGGTASGSDARTAAIMLVLLAAVAQAVVFVRRKAGAGGQWRF